MKRLASLVFLLPALAFAHAPEPKVVSLIALNLQDNGSNPDIVTTNLSYLFVPASPASLLYDPDGNLTNDGHFTYVWNSENQLTSVASLTNTPANSKRKLTFEYDALGRRIRAGVSRWTNNTWLVTSSNKFVYDGWDLVAELNATNNTLIRGYAWGLDLSGTMDEGGGVGGLLWVNDKAALGSNSTQFVSYDGNGNVSALVDAGSGNETARYEYGPFGDLTQASGLMARANPIRFSSKYHDDYTGLIYYGYRYYSPTFQRWLNRDPLGEEGGLNLYGFVENDPVNGFDPLGLDPSMNQLFWTSVYDNGRSDAGRFLKRGGKGAAQMGIGMAKQIYGTMLNPLGSAYDGYQSLANMYQSTANLGAYLGKLSAEPCERQRALNALQNYAASPEAYADATLFIESLLAGRLMAPEAAAARIGSFADDAARIEIAAAKGIAKIDDGIPLTGITRFDQPAVEAQHFGRFLDLVREQGFKPRPYGGLTEARAQFRGNGLFVYNPNTMTVMDMLHEIKHIQQFRRSGFNPFSNPLTEPQAYNFERFLLRDQPNVNPAYLEYLQGMPK